MESYPVMSNKVAEYRVLAVVFNFLSIGLMVDMGIFRWIAIIFKAIPTYKTQHTVPSFDLDFSE